MNRIHEGFAYSRNPLFQNNVSKVSLKPEDVDCLMFCSKNYKSMLKNMKQINEKYRIICHYTITAYDTCLNGCKYCYANKRPDLAKEIVKLHDKNSPLLLGNIRETDKITESKVISLIIEDKGKQISLI